MISALVSGLAVAAVGALSARWNWWRPSRPGIPILMYHKVGDPPEGSQLKKLWVSTDVFRNQLAYLAEHQYTPITFRELYAHWDNNHPLPPRPVIITFDDGYANNYENAFPILRDFGFKAVLFVVVQTVGWDNRWHDPKSETRINMISWAQLKDLQKAGWEIGSHTMNHPNLQKIEMKEVKVEMEKSRSIITEFLEEAPHTFAYPYGSGEDVPSIREKVKEVGYRIAVGVHAGKWNLDQIKNSPYNLPRVFVRGDDTMIDFHLQLTRGQSRL
ncbi:MAG: Poly-beta-1,6-N-acetyl-D-glucosamine N-deacetylase [Elusimicrobia bacterium]|nr:Poly-beta-1,6-N-acetyl-D-glucosamine N-deacetylase [Elusimicrobiota bacterium]